MSDFEFMRGMPFAEYTPRDTWLQKIDPRALLATFILLLVAFMTAQSIFALVGALVICLLGVWISRVPLRIYLHGYLSAAPFILILAVINLFFNTVIDTTPAIFRFRSVVITGADFWLVFQLIMRFTITIILISIMSSTISTSRFIHGLESLLSPVRMIGIQIHDFIVSIEISIRFIPILTLTAERIAKAQASRGAVWGSGRGNPISRARQMAPVIIPLFIQSLHKAEALALAMDARGYGILDKHTSFTRTNFKATDGFFMVIGFLISLGIFIANYLM